MSEVPLYLAPPVRIHVSVRGYLAPTLGRTALRKDAGLCCGSRLRKGEVFAYVGSIQNLKDLKDLLHTEFR